jgi:hypothetical protein
LGDTGLFIGRNNDLALITVTKRATLIIRVHARLPVGPNLILASAV